MLEITAVSKLSTDNNSITTIPAPLIVDGPPYSIAADLHSSLVEVLKLTSTNKANIAISASYKHKKNRILLCDISTCHP